jgi:hypothetical protein
MDVLRRSARKSRLKRIKNEHIKEIMGVKGKPDIIDKTTTMVWPRQEDARGEAKKRTSSKNMDGGSIRSHDSEKSRKRSMEKQGGIAFGFRKTATAVTEPDRYTYIYNEGHKQ